MNEQIKPTESELEILNILWRKGPLNVKEVNFEMSKESGYTTTLKLLQIMFEKGLVDRKKEGRAHIYFAKAGEKDVKEYFLRKTLNSVFSGSASGLVMQLLGSEETTQKEIEKIRNLLDEIEGRNGDV